MEKLTLIQALCLTRTGWSTEEDRQLFIMAENVIREESKRLYLIYKKELIENELKQINNK
jgi:hypothetical protein